MKSILTLIFLYIALLLAAQSVVKFSPIIIPLSDTEILNPGRGLARWQQKEGLPFPTVDHYQRVRWSDIEKSKAVYDFSMLKAEAEATKNDIDGRGLFGLAVRCLDSGIDHSYPTYIDELMIGEWHSANKSCWVPNWNDPYFLERQDSMVAALGREFNNDPRVGYVEIRSYGNWGEWHMSRFETPPMPAVPITRTTILHMIDTYIKAFPDKQLIMLTDQEIGLEYALSKTNLKYPIGWRRDSWLSDIFDNWKSSIALPLALERWKIAPVIIESVESKKIKYKNALRQIIDYHVSSIGNTNDTKWNEISQGVKDTLINCIKYAGYRFILRNIQYPKTISSGQIVNLKSEWSNVGVSPIYRDWKVYFRLCNPTTGAVLYEAPSTIDLRKLLPTYSFTTNVDTPISYLDSFVVPSDFKNGNYNLELIITDPTTYLAPLKLAIKGRKINGAYDLGTIVISTKNSNI